MNLLADIRRQPHAVRVVLWALSSFIVLGAVSYLAFQDLERTMFMAINEDPQAREEFLARQRDRSPQVLATVTDAVGDLGASIGSLIGWSQEDGFTRTEPGRDTPQLLPLSQ